MQHFVHSSVLIADHIQAHKVGPPGRRLASSGSLCPRKTSRTCAPWSGVLKRPDSPLQQHPGLPLAAAKRNLNTEDQNIVNSDRLAIRTRGNAGKDLPKKRARGTLRIVRQSITSPLSERHGGGRGGLGPLSPPVELGQQRHRHRVGAPRYRSRGPRAAHAF